ncbi:MAG: cache domain-containing protein, partial [Chloroflexota bacterium]
MNLLRAKSSARTTILLACALILVMVVATATLLLDLRQRELERANDGLSSLSQVLAEQTTRTFQGITLMMRSTSENLSDAIGQQLSLDSQPVNWLLRNRVSGLPQVKSMVVVDRDGMVANSSRSDFIRRLAVSERSFFRHYADGATDEIFISLPEQAKNDGEWTFYVSVRLSDRDGGFRGVLAAAISIKHFEDLYAGIRLHFVDKIQLLTANGMLLAGTPHDEHAFGRSGRDAFTLAPMKDGTQSVLVDTDEATGARRLIAYHAVANYPLKIGVAVDEQEALMPWRQITGPVISGLLLLVAGIIGTSVLLVRNRIRQEALTRALQRSDEKLRQMIQSVRDAIVTVDAGGRVVLFNTAASRMFGIA